MSIISKIIIALAAKAERQAQADKIAFKSANQYILRERTEDQAKLWYLDDSESEEEEVFCDVCGINYPEEEPCQFH